MREMYDASNQHLTVSRTALGEIDCIKKLIAREAAFEE